MERHMPIGTYLRPVPPKPTPRGPLAPVANLGSVEFVTLSLEKAHTVEQLAELAYARADKFMIVLVESGSIAVTQRKRQCQLEESQYALFDCAHAVSFAATGDYRLLGIFIPSFLLQARLRNAPTIAAQPLPCTGSPWRIASNLLRMLASEIRHIPVPMAYGYANQVVELVSIAVEADTQLSGDISGRNAIFRRCSAYVKAHLADGSLDPNKISNAMGISVRYLHKVFQESGESVCEFLRSTRLETSRMDLADPQKAQVQIREIAHRVGFRSQAHFAAAFKQRYGISATEWRREALQKLGTDPLRKSFAA
jgi:AraC-like DNA-binding protein